MSKQESLFKTKVVPGKPGSGNLFDEEIISADGPVTCLGLEFENDNARRAHFTEELRKKLQDPEFRTIEGFPIGKDEDILKLSDPPYYTACPNPWIADFIAEARDRWYVPDPNKAGDLEKLREKALLKEFEVYKQAKKKLKGFRLEAVRAGFKKEWQERDYGVIITVAKKIPNNVLEEDLKLLMWYDQAVTRMGGE